MKLFNLYSDKFVLFVLLFFIATLTNAAPSSSSATCEETNPVCLKNMIQAAIPKFARGIPEWGVEVLDPFYIHKLELMLAGGLKIMFREGYSKGVRKCVVEKARLHRDTLETSFLCNLTIKGKYKSSGRLLMFPINGDGDATIKCKNIKLDVILKLKSTPGPSSTHLEIVNATTNYSYDGRIQYNLTNLFKGSSEMSKAVLEFMNQNWQLVAQEFGDPIVEFGINTILRNIKKMFSMAPVNVLFAKWKPTP